MNRPSRERMHELIREAGKGDLLDRFNEMAAGHMKMIEATLAICERHECPIFRVLERKAKGCRRALNFELDHPALPASLGYWGKNGNAPAIENMLRSAQYHENQKGA